MTSASIHQMLNGLGIDLLPQEAEDGSSQSATNPICAAVLQLRAIWKGVTIPTHLLLLNHLSLAVSEGGGLAAPLAVFTRSL